MSEHTYKATIEVDVEVVLNGIHGYTPATRWEPEEPAGFDHAEVWILLFDRRVLLFADDPLYAELVDEARIDAGEKAQDDPHERGDYLYEQMKDRRDEG